MPPTPVPAMTTDSETKSWASWITTDRIRNCIPLILAFWGPVFIWFNSVFLPFFFFFTFFFSYLSSFFSFFPFFWDKISLCNPGEPGTHYIILDGNLNSLCRPFWLWNHRDLLASASQILRLKNNLQSNSLESLVKVTSLETFFCKLLNTCTSF